MISPVQVVANFGAAVAVLDVTQQVVVRAVPLSKIAQLVAGDCVQCEREAGGTWRVVKLLPRTTVLQRPDRRGHAKPLAANLTHLAIVSASPPGIDTLLIDQFCVAAELAGINPMVLVNKADLLNSKARADCESWLMVYQNLGYPAVMIDTKFDAALAPLRAELANRTVALVGASGVGKSSIVKRLLPDLDVRIGAISTATGLGAHTTTVTYWYELADGCAIIDSPGVRQFSVAHLSSSDVRAGYLDIAAAAQNCRFSNCTHLVEPSCAVRDAVDSKDIAAWRFDNYRKLAVVDSANR